MTDPTPLTIENLHKFATIMARMYYRRWSLTQEELEDMAGDLCIWMAELPEEKKAWKYINAVVKFRAVQWIKKARNPASAPAGKGFGYRVSDDKLDNVVRFAAWDAPDERESVLSKLAEYPADVAAPLVDYLRGMDHRDIAKKYNQKRPQWIYSKINQFIAQYGI
jgi:hypothetical protein